jgi:AcrR family transcriptional regulator
MPRHRRHSDEAMFDAVRELVLEGGARAVTIAAVSKRSGAPTGTIYHRFGSRAGLVAHAWLATVTRLQTEVASIADAAKPGLEGAVAIALATVDFCARNPSDARLLTLASKRELQGGEDMPAEVAEAIEGLNAPTLSRLREIGRAAGRTHDDQAIVFAAVSIPYVAVRQALNADVEIGTMRSLVEVAARAALGLPPVDTD